MKLFMVREPCNDVSCTLIKLFFEINICMLYLDCKELYYRFFGSEFNLESTMYVVLDRYS